LFNGTSGNTALDNSIDSNTGIISIEAPKSSDTTGRYTDDSSTIIKVNLKDQYNSLDTYFANAVSLAVDNLINGSYTTSSVLTNNNQNVLSGGFKVADNAASTDILSNFFYEANTGLYNYIDFNDIYGNDAENPTTDPYLNPLFDKDSDYANVRYAINTVVSTYKNVPFYLIRDTFGVHLVAIDGYTYIKDQVDAQSGNDAKQQAFLDASVNVLKYRNLIAQKSSGYTYVEDTSSDSSLSKCFSNTNLKSYFESN